MIELAGKLLHFCRCKTIWGFSYGSSSGDKVDTQLDFAPGRDSWKIFEEDIRKVAGFRDALDVFNFLLFVTNMG